MNDDPYPNGVVGKHIVYNMEERQRVKIVDYVGSKKVETSKIEDKLREENIDIRLDSFIDPAKVQQVAGIVRKMYAEKGYEYATVKPSIQDMPGGPKLVHLSFVIDQGPKVKIRDIEFVGNKAFSDGKLERPDEGQPLAVVPVLHFGPRHLPGGQVRRRRGEDRRVLPGPRLHRGAGRAARAEGDRGLQGRQDALGPAAHPGDRGRALPVGKFDFAGNKVVKTEALRPLFKVKTGEYYSEKKIKKGIEKAQELYGTGGFFEFTAYPDLKPSDQAEPNAAGEGPAPPPKPAASGGPPTVDVTMRMQEGKQSFVNRITFVGNNTTHDSVIRREMRLYEGGVFNTEALKYSIKRLNQLGYFKQLEGDAINVEKAPDKDNAVDVKLKVEEQNRNQLTFGAGVSQFEGFFGQLSFQTANFLGRGETFSVSAQQGSLAKNYQVGLHRAVPVRARRSPAASTSTSGNCTTRVSSRRPRRAATSPSGSRWPTSPAPTSTTATSR